MMPEFYLLRKPDDVQRGIENRGLPERHPFAPQGTGLEVDVSLVSGTLRPLPNVTPSPSTSTSARRVGGTNIAHERIPVRRDRRDIDSSTRDAMQRQWRAQRPGLRRPSTKLALLLTWTGNISLQAPVTRRNPTAEQMLGIEEAPDVQNEYQVNTTTLAASALLPLSLMSVAERQEIKDRLQFEIESMYINSSDVIYDFLISIVQDLVTGRNENASESNHTADRLDGGFRVLQTAGLNYQNLEVRLGFDVVCSAFPLSLKIFLLDVDLEIPLFSFDVNIRGIRQTLHFSGHIIAGVGFKWNMLSQLIELVASSVLTGEISGLPLLAELYRQNNSRLLLTIYRFLEYTLERRGWLRTLSILRAGGSLATLGAIVAGTAAITVLVVGVFSWMVDNARANATRRLMCHYWSMGYVNYLFLNGSMTPQKRLEFLGGHIHHQTYLNAFDSGYRHSRNTIANLNFSKGDMVKVLTKHLSIYDDRLRINITDRQQIISHLEDYVYREYQAP